MTQETIQDITPIPIALDTIWVVEGTTGSYEDRQEWIFSAYPDKESAEAVCEQLMAWVSILDLDTDDNFASFYDGSANDNYDKRAAFMIEHVDSGFVRQYDAVRYQIYPVDFKRAVTQPQEKSDD